MITKGQIIHKIGISSSIDIAIPVLSIDICSNKSLYFDETVSDSPFSIGHCCVRMALQIDSTMSEKKNYSGTIVMKVLFTDTELYFDILEQFLK